MAEGIMRARAERTASPALAVAIDRVEPSGFRVRLVAPFLPEDPAHHIEAADFMLALALAGVLHAATGWPISCPSLPDGGDA